MAKLELRQSFWTPWEQMREHLAKKFTVIGESKNVDPEIKRQLFDIKLEDGSQIDAWHEEIYAKTCLVNGQWF